MSKLFITDAKVTSEKFEVTASLRMPSLFEVAAWKKQNPEYVADFLLQAVDLCIDFDYQPEEGDETVYLKEFPQALMQDQKFIKDLLLATAPFLGIDPEQMQKVLDAQDKLKKAVEKRTEEVEQPEENIAKN